VLVFPVKLCYVILVSFSCVILEKSNDDSETSTVLIECLWKKCLREYLFYKAITIKSIL